MGLLLQVTADRQLGDPARSSGRWLHPLGRVYAALGGLILLADAAVLLPGLLPYRPWGSRGGLAIAVAGAALAGWGLFSARAGGREWVTNANLVLLSLLVASPVLLEIVFRSGIALGVPLFRQPGLYANSDSEDEYWKMVVAWGLDRGDTATAAGQLHPEFGWATPVTPENPLGILRHGPYVPEFEGPVVLFYGDSFTAGSRFLEPGARVSDFLEHALGGPPVYNYAGGGYGLDQIVLRLRATHRLFADPTLIVGILPGDLDRSVLSFRSGAKPYFDTDDGGLVLRGVPILLDPADYVRRHPPVVRSYLLAYARQQTRRLAVGGDLSDIAHRRDEKLQVNRALLAAAADEARGRGVPMLWVLFEGPREFDNPSWREEFLIAEFKRHGFSWLDTRAVIRAAAAETGRPLEAYFFEDSHPNELGNRAVGEALALMLSSR